MENLVEELDKVPYNDFIEMKAQLADICQRRDGDKRALQALQNQVNNMENVFKKQLEPLNARFDNLAAAVSSLHDVLKGHERLPDNTDVTVCANGIKVSHERIDAILKQVELGMFKVLRRRCPATRALPTSARMTR
jgi:hypothetical protein